MNERLARQAKTAAVAAALLCSALLPGRFAIAASGGQVLPVRQLQVGGQAIQAQVAATPKSRQTGLMFRESLAPGHGMLFAFSVPDYYCFWMKNTPLPLSIAFISASDQITSIFDMQPNTETHHCSYHAVPYALEMPQGWFRQHNIGAGEAVDGLPGLPAD